MTVTGRGRPRGPDVNPEPPGPPPGEAGPIVPGEIRKIKLLPAITRELDGNYRSWGWAGASALEGQEGSAQAAPAGRGRTWPRSGCRWKSGTATTGQQVRRIYTVVWSDEAEEEAESGSVTEAG